MVVSKRGVNPAVRPAALHNLKLSVAHHTFLRLHYCLYICFGVDFWIIAIKILTDCVMWVIH